jgi:hypothetical protein
MKNKLRPLSLLMTILFVLTLTAAAPVHEEAPVRYVTESLNSYLLGYMSWGVKSMGLDTLQERLEKSGRDLPEVRVAVIDSGISRSNKYVQGRYTDDGYNFVANNTDFDDDQYHGTMVSGIIIDGTPSNVKILPLKTNNASGSGMMKNVSRAIFYAIDHGADVINLSLSSDDPKHTLTILDDAINAALEANIIIVVAAGNQSGDVADRYPANKSEVLTITSVDSDYQIADSANTGAEVDFALPGVKILAPYKSIMMRDSGTSLAAPHAAAAAAMLKTWDKSLNQYQVTEILKRYAVDLGAKGYDTTYGWGMIDLSGFDFNEAVPAVPTEPTEAPTEAPTIPPTDAPTEAVTVPPTEGAVLRGDTDRDGTVTIVDTTTIQRALAFLTVNAYDEQAADVDGDGAVSIIDATAIQRYLAQYGNPYGIGERIG